jgi:hypothetical protein
MSAPKSAATQAADVAKVRVLEAVLVEEQPAVVVASPPGAGKTTLIEAVAATGVHEFKLRVAVVAPRVEQTIDFVRRYINDYVLTPVTLLHSASREPPADFATLGVGLETSAADLPSGHSLTVATAKKLAVDSIRLAGQFDLLIVDEAYQLPWKEMMPLFDTAKRVLLVGDPGQLLPIVGVDAARFEAAPNKVHWPAPREMQRLHPALRKIRLPATWRFPQDTVDFIQPAFYPDLPFVSGASPETRGLSFKTRGIGDSVDKALDMVAGGKTMVALLLPERPMEAEDVDGELAELAATVVKQVLRRGGRGPDGKALSEDAIGYVDAHVASNATVQRSLRKLGVIGTQATTPEIWQGRQRPLMIAKHTLSSAKSLDTFSLEPGRLCVMTSRHQYGCIIVGRAGIGKTLEEHRHNCADWPSGAESLEWIGWNANKRFWDSLEKANRIVSV